MDFHSDKCRINPTQNRGQYEKLENEFSDRTEYLACGSLSISTVSAQGNYYGDSYDDRGDYVIIYEHCDFKGASRSLDVGEYRRMRDIGFDNDTMSSIRVPRDFEVIIYEDDRYGGAYARIDRDIRCFDRSWNDKVSSMRVEYGGYADRPRRDDRGYQDEYRGPRVGDGRRYGNDSPRNYELDASVTGKNVSQVVFSNSVLQQVSKKQWQMNSPRGGVSQYRETSRDKNSVYLQNDYTAERVRIDTYANDVTFTNRQGQAAALPNSPQAKGSGLSSGGTKQQSGIIQEWSEPYDSQ